MQPKAADIRLIRRSTAKSRKAKNYNQKNHPIKRKSKSKQNEKQKFGEPTKMKRGQRLKLTEKVHKDFYKAQDRDMEEDVVSDWVPNLLKIGIRARERKLNVK